MKKLRRWQIALIALAAAAALLAGVFFIYVGAFYRADAAAIAGFTAEAVWEDHGDTGIVFYPGAKVEAAAYEPLKEALEARGYRAFIVEMPFNIAFFGMNRADGVIAAHPEIKHWYAAGHSLGGAVASIYASGSDAVEGVILLAAYSTKELDGKRVISIRASEDGVLNAEQYEKNRKNLPPDAVEEVIHGGCHAGFGMYGAQSGDGTPSITSAEQIETTAGLISRFLQRSYQ